MALTLLLVAAAACEKSPAVSYEQAAKKIPVSLHEAARVGSLEHVRAHLAAGAPADLPAGRGEVPLWGALENDKPAVVEALLVAGANPNTKKTRRGWTPLVFVVREGKLDLARLLLKYGSDPDLSDSRGVRPLIAAAHKSNAEAIEMLLDAGASVEARDTKGATVWQVAFRRKARGLLDLLAHRHRAFVERQEELAAGQLMAKPDVAELSPARQLFRLTEVGLTGPVARRLDQVEDLDVRDSRGRTLLHAAARSGDLKLATLLLDRGGELSAPDKHGRSPLHLAAEEGQAELVRFLLERGGRVDIRDKDKDTPLHRVGSVQSAKLLLERGADLHARNNSRLTPLHQAASAEVAGFMLAQGADLRARDIGGRTPLHAAAARGAAELCALLLKAGADPEAKTRKGKTPRELVQDGPAFADSLRQTLGSNRSRGSRNHALRIDGPMNQEVVLGHVSEHMHEVRGCIEKARIGRPALRGTVVIWFRIASSGRVAGVGVKVNETGSPRLATCLMGKVKKWRFPKHRARVVTVFYPFLVESSAP